MSSSKGLTRLAQSLRQASPPIPPRYPITPPISSKIVLSEINRTEYPDYDPKKNVFIPGPFLSLLKNKKINTNDLLKTLDDEMDEEKFMNEKNGSGKWKKDLNSNQSSKEVSIITHLFLLDINIKLCNDMVRIWHEIFNEFSGIYLTFSYQFVIL